MRIVTESEFAERIREMLANVPAVGSVTGPGRSGAVAAVYASHILGIPFIPFGAQAPLSLGRVLLIDTALYAPLLTDSERQAHEQRVAEQAARDDAKRAAEKGG